MRFPFLLAITCTATLLRGAAAAPFDNTTAAGSDPESLRRQNCQPDILANTTWMAQGVDAFLANASHYCTQYSYDNVQGLAAYLGAPNFYCGVGNSCNAGQPCSPVGFPGWYVLMAIQGWNEYVNNLNAAIMYTASILGLKLGKVVDDLWPKKKDNVTPMKMTMAWINGIINAFPVTATFGKYAGMLGANVQGFNIITGGMMFPPSVGEQYVHWSQIGDQVGSLVGEYKKAIGAYAKSVLDAPIADPQWGINRMLSGGRFLARSNNFTQDDFDGWMYQSIEVNAIGLILQAQNVYVIRTFNMTGCHDSLDGVMCEAQPNGAWTQWRLHVKDADDYMPENDRAAKLYRSYGFNKERLLKGPSDCFDASDYVQLTNPWDAATERSAELDPWMLCNFNLNVCNFDASEDNHDTGDVENYVPAHTDRMCERQGIVWS